MIFNKLFYVVKQKKIFMFLFSEVSENDMTDVVGGNCGAGSSGCVYGPIIICGPFPF